MIETSRIRQLVLFGVLAVVSYALYNKYFGGEASQLFQPFTRGYALTGVTIETTDEQGQIMTTIQSPAVIHYADSEKTLIEQPNVVLHDKGGDWVFQSLVGEINAQQTQIFFPDEVLINLENQANTQTEELVINTSALTVDMTNKTGKTEAELQMSQVGSLVKGMGAVVDFNQQEIEILSEMYAEYKN